MANFLLLLILIALLFGVSAVWGFLSFVFWVFVVFGVIAFAIWATVVERKEKQRKATLKLMEKKENEDYKKLPLNSY